MARGFKTGGRKVGSPNKRRKSAAVTASRTGALPAELLLKMARGERTAGMGKPTRAEIFEARKAAAPYFNPRLAAVLTQQAPQEAKVDGLSRIQAARQVAFALAEGAELVKREMSGAQQQHGAPANRPQLPSPPVYVEVDLRSKADPRAPAPDDTGKRGEVVMMCGGRPEVVITAEEAAALPPDPNPERESGPIKRAPGVWEDTDGKLVLEGADAAEHGLKGRVFSVFQNGVTKRRRWTDR